MASGFMNAVFTSVNKVFFVDTFRDFVGGIREFDVGARFMEWFSCWKFEGIN